MINGIQAGLMEARGEGRFEQKGKKIEFRDNQDRPVASWYGRTSKQASQQIRIFRASPKHVEAA
jgi:hypothetical protein